MLTNTRNSYVNFQLNNEILFKTRIVRGQGIAVSGAYYDNHVVGRADVIDINQDSTAQMNEESAGFLRKRYMYNEPVLDSSVNSLQDIARRRGEEVLTRESLGTNLQVKGYGVDMGRTAFQDIQGVERNFRTLDGLVNEVTGDREAQWAISPSTREFFIYKHGEQKVETPKPAPEPSPVEPLKVLTSETKDHTFQSVHQQGDGFFTVFMRDDESISIHDSNGRQTRMEGAVPSADREGVMQVLQAANSDPDFSIQTVRVTREKETGAQDFLVTDNSNYYEYSSRRGFQSGELGR